MYYIDQGDGVNYHPMPLLETVAAVVYLNLVIVKREWQHLITHCLDSNSQITHCKSIEDAFDILRKFEMEHTVRFSVWLSPKGFGDNGKDIYLTKLKNVFCKKFKRQDCRFLNIAKLMLKNISYMKEFAIISKRSGWMFVGEIFGKKLFGKQIMHLHLLKFMFSFFSILFRHLHEKA